MMAAADEQILESFGGTLITDTERRNMKTLLLLIAINLLSLTLWGETNNWEKRIQFYRHRPIWGLINPHIDTIQTLVVDGKKYPNVRGFEPYYIPLTNINSILFVVNEKNHLITFHIFRMETSQDVKITYGDQVFGNTIGWESQKLNPNHKDSAKAISNDIILTSTLLMGNSKRVDIELDLKNKRIISIKTLQFDQRQNVIKEESVIPYF